jgi:hypothetical protein
MILLEGRLTGEKKIKQMYAAAPGAFYKAIRHRMYSERKRYIGTRGYDGKFWRSLNRMKRGGQGEFKRQGNWPANVVRALKGHMQGAGKISTMVMRLGIGIRKKNKFLEGLARLDTSYTGSRTSSSNKFMPIPVYRNLSKYVSDPNGKTFYSLLDQGRLVPIVKGNKILYFMNEGKYKKKSKTGSAYKRNALVFIGTKKITVKPKFTFVNYMVTEESRIAVRARREIDGTVRRLNRGIIKSGDFNKVGG